ncbi:hypothetical protein PGB90_003463 [Kerria lacca]
MGSKKKNKAKKLARMTEEERLRYLQHRAAIEKEVQRRKQELITTYLRTKLEHEEAFLRLNSAKINQQWRHILRQIKCKELKEDVETLKQRFEIVLQCKNKVVENLFSDFDKAEYLYSLQFKTHMDATSKFLEIHRVRLTDLHNWYLQQLKDILSKNEGNQDKYLTEFQNDFETLKTTWNSVNTESLKELGEMEKNFDDKKNELQTKLLYKMVKLEEKYADDLNKTKKKYDQILEQFKQNTDTKYAHYKILSEKDDSNTLQIIHHFEEIANLTERIDKAKIELHELENKNREEMDQLNSEKGKLSEELQKLQHLNNQNLANDRKQLKFLVNISNKVIKELSALVKEGDKMIQLADKCNKLNGKKEIPALENDDIEISSTYPYQQLRNFWRIYNMTKLENDNLIKEKTVAMEENKKLKKLLHFYMISVRRSSSVPRKCGF